VIAFSGPVYSILLLSFAILMIGRVMRKGIFSIRTANLGMISGILGIFSVVGGLVVFALGEIIIVTSLFTAIWVLLVVFRLALLIQP